LANRERYLVAIRSIEIATTTMMMISRTSIRGKPRKLGGCTNVVDGSGVGLDIAASLALPSCAKSSITLSKLSLARL